MGRHADAQKELAAAFDQVFGRSPTKNERLFAGAIALGESSYSRAKYTNKLTGESKVLNNFGAIQCPSNVRPCPAGSFEVSDYEVLPDGTHKPFNQCYCDDATREAAAIRFIKTLYQKRPALLEAASVVPADAFAQLMALKGVNAVDDPAPLYDGKGTAESLDDPYYRHIAWFSHVMRDSGYFGLELKKHIGAQIRYHNEIAAETNERIDGGPRPMPNPKVPTEPAGSSVSVYLEQLLSALQRDADHKHYPKFGIEADSVIRSYQKTRGLKADGVVGALTLAQLEKELASE